MSNLTLEQVEALIARQARAWIDADIDAALAEFAPDADFISPGGRWKGHAQIRSAMTGFYEFAHEVDIQITRVVYDGARFGAVEWTWFETVRADNRRRMAEDAIVFEIQDGKLVYWREYFDTAQMDRPVE